MTVLGGHRRRLAELQERVHQAPGSEPALAAFKRDRRLGGNLLAAALAFRLFAVLLPLALLLAVGVGYAAVVDDAAVSDAGAAVGIKEATLESVARSSKLESDARWLVAAFGVVALLYAAVKAARAVHAAHCLAWTGAVERLAHPLRAGIALVAVLLAIGIVWALVGSARAELGAAGIVIALAAAGPFFAIWLWASMRLPHGHAPWRALVPGALLVAAGLELIHLGTVLFVARHVERASATYGPLGAAFTILVWLFVLSRVMIGSAMLNAALWHGREAPE